MRSLAALTLCALACAAHPARADSPSVSFSTWTITGKRVVLRFLVPSRDAQRLLGRELPVVTTGKLGRYLLAHTAVKASGKVCPAQDQGYDIGRVDPLSVGPDLYGFEIFFQCPVPRRLVLEDTALFDRLPGHVNFARIRLGDGYVQQLFTADRERLPLPDSGAMPPAGLGRYAPLGMRHIVHNLDHLCFLLGLLLLVRGGRELALPLLGIACGSVLSLAVVLSGWITPRTPLLDSFVGFLVALLAAQLITRELRRPGLGAAAIAGLLFLLAGGALVAREGGAALLLAGAALIAGGLLIFNSQGRAQGVGMLLPAAVFGFLEGFVLPSVLTPMRPGAGALLPMATGFDLGMLLTETALLLLPAGAYLLLRTRNLVPPRPLVNDLAAALLGGLGMYWLVGGL